MTVTKRTRFEVLRRDNYTCRYCRSKENELTIDHVIPVSLGGSDDPTNLVAACKDCNAGKASAAPDQGMIAQVDEDSLRWAQAMKLAAERAAKKRSADAKTLEHFRDHAWYAHEDGHGRTMDLPNDWELAIERQLASGLTMSDLEEAVKVTASKPWVKTDHFRYFMGVCRNMLTERLETARTILTEYEESNAG